MHLEPGGGGGDEDDTGSSGDNGDDDDDDDGNTRSSWLNCALRDDEAVYWVSIGHYEAIAVGN